MAASIYATPPPDLSSEDTALSDVSNSSTLNTNRGGSSNNSSSNNNNNNSNNNNHTTQHEATVACDATTTMTTATTTTANKVTAAKTPSSPTLDGDMQPAPAANSAAGSSTNDVAGDNVEEYADADADGETETEADTDADDSETGQAAMAAMAAAANAAMQLQLLEALNDAAKKRRKQHNPSRLEALNLSDEADETAAVAAIAAAAAADTNVVDYEEKLSKMFLPKSIEKLKETFELLQQQQQQQQTENISVAGKEDDSSQLMKNPYQTFCKQCGENFETEFKLSLHMLQEHAAGAEQPEPMDFLASVKVKLERSESPTQRTGHELQQQQQQQQQQLQQQSLEHAQQLALHRSLSGASNGKDHWLTALPPGHPGLPPAFAFPPEAAAAAALSAGGYLPLLGMPGFPSVDGLNRPPLRIFNPEAYCELCNKEFCNKYFLKTHKANKHGIFDPVDVSNGSSTNNNNNNNSSNSNNNNNNNSSNASAVAGLNAMNQMFQLQMQREPPKQPVESLPTVAQQLTPPAPPAVHCDICSKRFTNVFAMRRHRNKVHDQPLSSSSSSSPNSNSQQQQQQQPRRGSPNEPIAISSTASVNHIKQESASSPEATAIAELKPFQMPEGFREDFTLEQEEVSFTPAPRKLSSALQQQARDSNFAHDKLKRLGVLQPEAFCELCCKEYCNKYFLRTHKWKRHGIFVPPDELKDDQLQLAQKMAWPFMNLPGMPLNLMLANEKARLMAAAAAATATEQQQNEPQSDEQMAKRIKLEPMDGEPHDMYDSMTPEQPEHVSAEKLEAAAATAAADGSAMGLQNLQKLQSMLQQLNDFNGKRQLPLPCHLCGREMEHQYALQAHLMTEHAGMNLDGQPPSSLALQQQLYQQQQQQQAPLKLSPSGGSPVSAAANELRCQQCERDFATPQEFKQHIAEVHLMAGSPLRDGFYTPERPINSNAAGVAPPATRPPYTITPTSSYCEICNKELCNKYFMKTHMQRMHGIEIENGAQIGGVVCNICNKELCSKYFLRVHKHNTHGIIEDGAPLPQPRGQNGIKFEAQQQQQQQLMEQELARGQNLSPHGNANTTPTAAETSSVASGGSSNGNSYNELCPLCSRQFRSAKWLRTHLMNEHGAAGVEKLRELEQPTRSSKPNSPTLKIPNGVAAISAGGTAAATASAAAAAHLPNPANLAQALQNLNAQHLLGQMPSMFGAAVAEQAALQSPRFKEYQCSMCPFTTPYYAFLFIHERSHALLNSGDASNSQAALAEADAEAELPKTDRPAAFALIQGKVRAKQAQQPTTSVSSTRAADADIDHMEPTNLTKTRTPTPTTVTRTTTTPTTPSPKATPSPTIVATATSSFVASPKMRSTTVTPTPMAVSAAKPCTPSTQACINGNQRSAATSPFELCHELANGSGKPVSYALPDKSDEAYQMQAFHIAAIDADGLIAPAMIYLPVRTRLTEPAMLNFKLTPA